MTHGVASCVLLAERHPALTQGVRGLLETMFDSVVMVADETSLSETAARMRPEIAIVELALVRERNLEWLQALHARCPGLRVVVLSMHDEPNVRQAAIDAGADAVVLKRAIVTDLLPAIERVLAASEAG